jgi:hypothetical protein
MCETRGDVDDDCVGHFYDLIGFVFQLPIHGALFPRMPFPWPHRRWPRIADCGPEESPVLPRALDRDATCNAASPITRKAMQATAECETPRCFGGLGPFDGACLRHAILNTVRPFDGACFVAGR